MGKHLIEALDISKKYRGFTHDIKDNGIGLWIKNIFKLTSNRAASVHALKKINFTIDEGEIFGVYGSNGAGKTTLIKILSGILSADSGVLKVNGSSDNQDIKNTISYISTNGWMGLEWQLTVKENLILYGNIFSMKSKELEKKCEEILKLIGMDENSHKYISQLSAGMRQKLTIARGLLIDKPILYLDEPSVSLDVNAARKLRNIIKKYALENKKTIIVTSHAPEDLAICDRLMFLYQGEIVFIGTKDELYAPLKNRKVLDLKCFSFEDEHLEEITKLNVFNVKAYSSGNSKDYKIVKIIIEYDNKLVNEIIDILLSENVTVLSMNINELSLQEMYEYYIDVFKNKEECEGAYGEN